MKIKAIFLSITVIVIMILSTLIITHNNSKATMVLPDGVRGVTFRFNQTRYANIDVYAKNKDSGNSWSDVSDSNGDYDFSVDADAGANFYLKAWKASDPTQFDDANVYHPGSTSTLEHDFTLSPPS